MKRTVTDKQWEQWATKNPYYGVLGFESSSMDETNLERSFFSSGEEHIRSILDLIEKHFGGFSEKGSALDFGCGVGRLVLPLSQHFERVTGVDISTSMIELARKHVGSDPRIDFVRQLSELPGERRYQLVHSYIVLQHLRPSQGYPIIEQLVDRVAAGGFFALHMTVGDLRRARPVLNSVRYRVPPLHWLYNVVRNRPWNEPITEMNRYDLAKLIRLLRGRYQGPLAVREFDQGEYIGVMIIGKRA